MHWLDQLATFWPHIAAGFDFLAALLASIHAILNKRDSRAALLWIGVVWLLPVLGPLLYLSFGVNRIRRQALRLRVGRAASGRHAKPIPDDMGEPHRIEAEHLRALAHVADRVAGRTLLAGNGVQPLVDGDEAFPAMLAAIDSATMSVSLLTYIFDNDLSGKRFAEALGRAVNRGVQVRVLVDDAGARYSFPSITVA
jgi:cardiolipin synthase A/B